LVATAPLAAVEGPAMAAAAAGCETSVIVAADSPAGQTRGVKGVVRWLGILLMVVGKRPHE
jgi:hypothetical protein